MILIVGLGNPGKKYEKNRHNLGFMAAEQFLKNFQTAKQTVWEERKDFKSDIAHIEWKPKVGPLQKALLAKPKTYMNNSGMAVKLLTDFYKVKPEDIWILCDDVDLQLGALRIRLGGGTAGHRGTTSVMEALGTDKFYRFRMGIGRPKGDHGASGEIYEKGTAKGIDEYVLGDFTHQEWGKIRELIKHTAKALETALEVDMAMAMNKYNTK